MPQRTEPEKLHQAANNLQAGHISSGEHDASPVPGWPLTSALVEALVAHARACYPREACGLLAGSPGSVSRHYPASNVAQSAQWFEMDPQEQRTIFADIVKNGWYLLAIYHSHPRRAAIPSQNDLRMAAYPGVLSLIISLADWENPEIRGYWIGKQHTVEARLNFTA